MRYGIVSDIHSNLDALQTVLDELDRAGMDQLLCLGDIVGYGPNPNECCELLQARNCLAIAGNHDEAALSPAQADAFNSLAREAIVWTNRKLSPVNREFLAGLPRERAFPGFVMVHGAPVFHFAYIVSILDAASAFERVSAPLTFIGHTHVAEVYYQNEQGRTFHRKLASGGTVKLERSFHYILNPGSVGQPRDRNPQASFAYFDDESESVEVRRISYDVMKVRRRMRTANLPPELAERLSIGC
jgi:predicted phosphodiesterase